MSVTINGKGSLGDGARKILATLIGILLVYAIVFLGTLIRNNLKRYSTIGRLDRAERTLAIDGLGRVTVVPDIAVTTMGMVAQAKTVAEAQQKNTEVMQKLVVRLKQLGVDSKDIQTANYNIYPQYDYTEKGQTLRGYEVSQSVNVKIRDTAKASQVVGLAGEVGANNVGGLQFTVDDPEKYKTEARAKALAQVRGKARALSAALGVRLTEIVSYNEYEAGKGYPVYAELGGVGRAVGGGPSPSLEAGSTDVVLNVSVVFAIR